MQNYLSNGTQITQKRNDALALIFALYCIEFGYDERKPILCERQTDAQTDMRKRKKEPTSTHNTR